MKLYKIHQAMACVWSLENEIIHQLLTRDCPLTRGKIVFIGYLKIYNLKYDKFSKTMLQF